MQIDPNLKGIINLIIAICGVIGTIGVAAFPDYIPPGDAKEIVQTSALIFMIYGGLNSGANFLSSSKPGFLAPQDPPVVLAAQKVADLPSTAGPAVIKATKEQAVAAVADHQP